MKKSTIRLLSIEGAALLLAVLFNAANYNNYWNKTIFRTQTVDFNILASVLPTKLSYALLKNDAEAIQKTLNSNYDLFGLVVTNCQTKEKDCPEQTIKYWSNAKSEAPAWKRDLKVQELGKHPYSLLYNQPPLYPEFQYSTPHSKNYEPIAGERNNLGTVIGRVYYVRGIPPSYVSDLQRWIKQPFRDSGSNRLFLLSSIVCILGGFSVWAVIEIGIQKRKAYQRESENQLSQERYRFLESENLRREAETREIQERNRFLESENLRREAETREIQERNRLLETENRLARITGFIVSINDIVEQEFTSVIFNQIQDLEGILRRLKIDIDNITHDLRKAPLLGIESSPGKAIEDLTLLPLNEIQKNEIFESIVEYIQDTEQSIRVVKWVVKDLNEIANLDAYKINVQKEIKSFVANLPPNLIKDWLEIEFYDKTTEPLWINANSWHLKSIIKNVLYNSTAILADIYEESDYDFCGKIIIKCVQYEDQVGIIIEDNGTGLPETALQKLYQGVEKVNSNTSSVRGRGSIIVFSYLSLHCGTVKLANKPEGGAQIEFLFPLTTAPQAEVELVKII